MISYFTVVLKFTSDSPTRWHPTQSVGPFSVLSRGSFRSEDMAHAWAEKHVPGHSYEVAEVSPDGALRRLGAWKASKQ